MKLPEPFLQLGFATLLDAARDRMLLDGLRKTVASVSISAIDKELSYFASDSALAVLAAHGIRGETYFAVPTILREKPSLLGYYRLLHGYSQKQFYQRATGMTPFKSMELSNQISPRAAPQLDLLCRTFAQSAEQLLVGLGNAAGNPRASNDLCLLTFGAQLRGSFNNTKGNDGIKAVFATLKAIFEAEITATDQRSLTLRNAAGKKVRIEIAADPDVLVRIDMGGGQFRTVVAIEVKAGEDHSNIWNRVGEAEKSHLKARVGGATECWTIINVPGVSESQLRVNSPSSDRFYQLLELASSESAVRLDFEARVRTMVGL